MCHMHNCLNWLQLSHPVVSTFISLVRKTPWFGCTHSTDRRLTYMTTWYGPGTGHTVLHLMDCASHPSNMHLVKTLQQQLKWKALCGLAICTWLCRCM